MGLLRGAGAIGIAKVIYDQARKPQNQARIRAVVEKAMASRNRSSGTTRQARH
jgi:hypothetical protein